MIAAGPSQAWHKYIVAIGFRVFMLVCLYVNCLLHGHSGDVAVLAATDVHLSAAGVSSLAMAQRNETMRMRRKGGDTCIVV